jgi:diadenylate cyclase
MNVELGEAFLDALVRVGRMPTCDRVLLITSDAMSAEKLKSIKKKVIYAVHQPHLVLSLQQEGFEAVALPGLTAGRMDRLKAALVGAVSAGYLKRGENVLCAMSREESRGFLDTLIHLTAGEVNEENTSLAVTSISSDIPPQLLEVLVDLALRVGREGYEGRSVGTLIVVGDSTRVMEKSHPLTLNPFQGYSEVERNLFDAHVRDAILTFAMLDGAFVVRDDGVVLAAGRHIRVSDSAVELPLGLGARHTAGASISLDTHAVAIVVSQSSGTVRVFQDGAMVLEIQPSGRRADDGRANDSGRSRITSVRRRKLPVKKKKG